MRERDTWCVSVRGMICGGVCLLVAGCGPTPGELDAREQGNALTAQAYAALDDGQWDEAIRSLNEVLDSHPELSRLHLDVANLYLDHKKDPILAIYHYTRYLELRPDTSKREMLEARIHDARVEASRMIGEELIARIAAAEGVNAANTALRSQVAELQRKVKLSEETLTKTDSALREALALISRLQDSETRLSDALRLAQKQGTTGSATAKLPDNVPANRPRTYRVKGGDSLSKIARQVYGDGTLWARLLDANKDVLGGNPEHLQAGQVLVVP